MAAPSYPNASNFTPIGSILHVLVTLGAGQTRNTTHIIINRWRFNLDCTAYFPCVDDGPVVSFQGNIATNCGVAFTASLSPGDLLPNEVVFTADPPLVIPSETPSFCTVEFDVRVETRGNEATPGIVYESAFFDAPSFDGVCDMIPPISTGVFLAAFFRLCPDCVDDGDPCNGTEACDPNADSSANPCVPGIPPTCDDEDVCTLDSCDSSVPSPGDPCVHTPSHEGDCDLAACLACAAGPDGKATICHRLAEGEHAGLTLKVPLAALPSHCHDHGDSCGACDAEQ